jgi:hypothetical protein
MRSLSRARRSRRARGSGGPRASVENRPLGRSLCGETLCFNARLEHLTLSHCSRHLVVSICKSMSNRGTTLQGRVSNRPESSIHCTLVLSNNTGLIGIFIRRVSVGVVLNVLQDHFQHTLIRLWTWMNMIIAENAFG